MDKAEATYSPGSYTKPVTVTINGTVADINLTSTLIAYRNGQPNRSYLVVDGVRYEPYGTYLQQPIPPGSRRFVVTVYWGDDVIGQFERLVPEETNGPTPPILTPAGRG